MSRIGVTKHNKYTPFVNNKPLLNIMVTIQIVEVLRTQEVSINITKNNQNVLSPRNPL